MSKAAANIRFKAQLQRPASPKGASWCFLVLPANASAKLPTRSMTSVEGTLEGQPFRQQTQKSHARSLAALKARYARTSGSRALDDVLERTRCLAWLRAG